MSTTRDLGLIWGCTNCVMVAASGECGKIHAESCESQTLENFDFDNGQPYPDTCTCGAQEPLSGVPSGHSVTVGMMYDEHAEGCPNRSAARSADIVECDCETNQFSRSACDTCGSDLHGTRRAMHLWENSTEEI